MGLAAPAKALLSRIPSAKVIDLDAGCCGMAGSFGYTRDHYDVSRAIGERKLLPAARAHGARLGAGRRRHILPSPGRRLRRRHGGASRRTASLLTQRAESARRTEKDTR